MEIKDVHFVKSVHQLEQLPTGDLPEIAFAGRSNVGKSSLINRLVNRRSLVKVSSRPGKTQGLNYFLVNDLFHLVDLPGYGYAKVPKKMRQQWRGLIGSYIEDSQLLKAVVVIIDIRHAAKQNDIELLEWLKNQGVVAIPVYTKADKLKRSQQQQHAASLDRAFGLTPKERCIFSSKSGEGREKLLNILDRFIA